MRSYALAGNTRHYDAVIKALEARGLRLYPPSLPDWMHVLRLGVSL